MICKGVDSKVIPISEKVKDFDKLTGRQKLNALKKLSCRRKKDILNDLGRLQ